MFLVKYNDLQIYNFLKPSVYMVYIPTYLSTIDSNFYKKVVDSTTDIIPNLQSTKSSSPPFQSELNTRKCPLLEIMPYSQDDLDCINHTASSAVPR